MISSFGASRIRQILVIACSFGCLVPHQLPGQTQPARSRAKPKAPPSKPFTIERLIVRLQDVKNKEFTEPALNKKIEKDGIDFTATPRNLSRLKDAGASDALLEIVKGLAPAPPVLPPPPPKPAPTGMVEVTCAPAECLVALSDKVAIPTANGRVLWQGVAVGSVSISVSKEGFLPWSGSVKVAPNEKASISAVLKPTQQTQQLWGTQLKNDIVRALGGDVALKDTRPLLSFGEATIWGHDGRKYTSSLEMFLRAPDKAFFRTRAGKHSTFEVEFLPTFRSKSTLREEEARDTEAGLRLLLRNQIPALMDRLSVPGLHCHANSNQVRDGAELVCTSSTEELVVLLDENGRPKEVREEQPFGSGVHAFYSAYRPYGDHSIPTELSVVWSGSPKQGIAVQLQKVELNADPKKEDGYRLKRGKRLPGIGERRG